MPEVLWLIPLQLPVACPTVRVQDKTWICYLFTWFRESKDTATSWHASKWKPLCVYTTGILYSFSSPNISILIYRKATFAISIIYDLQTIDFASKEYFVLETMEHYRQDPLQSISCWRELWNSTGRILCRAWNLNCHLSFCKELCQKTHNTQVTTGILRKYFITWEPGSRYCSFLCLSESPFYLKQNSQPFKSLTFKN